MLFEFFGGDNATPLLELTFECSIDGALFEECSTPESVSGLEPGEHTFRVRAVDLAGNTDPTPASAPGRSPPMPVMTITSGPAGRVIDGAPEPCPGTSESAVFVFSADQPGSTFECSLDGSDFVPCTSPAAVVGRRDRQPRVRGPRHEPAARRGRGDHLRVARRARPGRHAPEHGRHRRARSGRSTRATSRPSRFSGSDNRTLAADLRFECALDGTAFNSCVSPQQFSDLTHGSHTLLVRAIDVESNVDATPAELHVGRRAAAGHDDHLRPGRDRREPDRHVRVRARTSPARPTCAGSTARHEPCTSPRTYTGLAAGEHLFAVIARGAGRQRGARVGRVGVAHRRDHAARSRRSPRARPSRRST